MMNIVQRRADYKGKNERHLLHEHPHNAEPAKKNVGLNG